MRSDGIVNGDRKETNQTLRTLTSGKFGLLGLISLHLCTSIKHPEKRVSELNAKHLTERIHFWSFGVVSV